MDATISAVPNRFSRFFPPPLSPRVFFRAVATQRRGVLSAPARARLLIDHHRSSGRRRTLMLLVHQLETFEKTKNRTAETIGGRNNGGGSMVR